MHTESPPQRPEGRLLYDAQQDSGRSIKDVAAQAGMSDTRWRQIVKGSMNVQGAVVPVVASAKTLARMATAVGLTPEQLEAAGRSDAAAMLRAADEPPGMATEDAAQRPAAKRSPQITDEIDLIYASKSMTAQQKLDAIRMVLQLRAQVDAELPALRATIIGEVSSPIHAEDS